MDSSVNFVCLGGFLKKIIDVVYLMLFLGGLGGLVLGGLSCNIIQFIFK